MLSSSCFTDSNNTNSKILWSKENSQRAFAYNKQPTLTPFVSTLSTKFAATVANHIMTKQEAMDTLGYILQDYDDITHGQLFDCFMDNHLLQTDSSVDRDDENSTYVSIYLNQMSQRTGVFLPLTKCYSPTCQPNRYTCYSTTCPNRRTSGLLRVLNSDVWIDEANKDTITYEASKKAKTNRASIDWIDHIPLHLRETTSRKELKRQAGIAELIVTEMNYCEDLDILHTVYAAPLLASTNIIASSARRQRFYKNVFGNYRDISYLHHSFYKRLRTQTRHSSFFVGRIGTLIMQHATSLIEPYNLYASNHIKAIYCLTIEQKNNPQFAEFLELQNSQKCTRRLGLRHYLTSPTLWIGKFKLMLEAILKNTTDDADQLSLKASIAILHDLLCRMNSSAISNSSPEDFRFEELLTSIYYYPAYQQQGHILSSSSHFGTNSTTTVNPELQLFPLSENCKLIREEALWLARSTHPLQPLLCHMFLFSHALILTHPRMRANGKIEYIIISGTPIPIRLLSIDTNTSSVIRRLSLASTSMVSTPLHLLNQLRRQKSVNSDSSSSGSTTSDSLLSTNNINSSSSSDSNSNRRADPLLESRKQYKNASSNSNRVKENSPLSRRNTTITVSPAARLLSKLGSSVPEQQQQQSRRRTMSDVNYASFRKIYPVANAFTTTVDDTINSHVLPPVSLKSRLSKLRHSFSIRTTPSCSLPLSSTTTTVSAVENEGGVSVSRRISAPAMLLRNFPHFNKDFPLCSGSTVCNSVPTSAITATAKAPEIQLKELHLRQQQQQQQQEQQQRRRLRQQQRRTLKICHMSYPDITFKLEFLSRSDKMIWENLLANMIKTAEAKGDLFNMQIVCHSLSLIPQLQHQVGHLQQMPVPTMTPAAHSNNYYYTSDNSSSAGTVTDIRCACAFEFRQAKTGYTEKLVVFGTPFGVYMGSNEYGSTMPYHLVLPNQDVYRLAVWGDRLIVQAREEKEQMMLVAYALEPLIDAFHRRTAGLSTSNAMTGWWCMIKRSDVICFTVGCLRGQPVIVYLTKRLQATWLVIVVPNDNSSNSNLLNKTPSLSLSPITATEKRPIHSMGRYHWYKKYRTEFEVNVKNPCEVQIVDNILFVRSAKNGVERIDIFNKNAPSTAAAMLQMKKVNWAFIGKNSSFSIIRSLTKNNTVDACCHGNHYCYAVASESQYVHILSVPSSPAISNNNNILRKVRFESQVHHVSVLYPFLVAFSKSVIEIRHLETTELVQVLRGKEIHFISNLHAHQGHSIVPQPLYFTMSDKTATNSTKVVSIHQLVQVMKKDGE
ncbi:hypothetical protein BDF20DRAFT_908812 [Mycotypha africana]|uniref:uncharacterized protein n=1 Tax=Mycotypha africana TaxID=64632 RepID=UPI0023001EB1|nr:uncharacterized protein BDF20DRAFT_908812 [Mycotypha africana]KAI8990990.1 hypothetical protein BDF20DRAFT_908812 [Mycotypha africana]